MIQQSGTDRVPYGIDVPHNEIVDSLERQEPFFLSTIAWLKPRDESLNYVCTYVRTYWNQVSQGTSLLLFRAHTHTRARMDDVLLLRTNLLILSLHDKDGPGRVPTGRRSIAEPSCNVTTGCRQGLHVFASRNFDHERCRIAYSPIESLSLSLRLHPPSPQRTTPRAPACALAVSRAIYTCLRQGTRRSSFSRPNPSSGTQPS
jgi:hypothetical protein